ncbi:MAG: PD40 domain-containing protein [Chloroflexi bacterium]|nr:PD40 domain-containing protein [Chloroflexota bacterium]
MKKLQIVFLFVLLAGCSSSQIVSPTVTPGIAQTPSLFPTQTLTPTSTSIPTPIPTAIGGGAGKIAFTSERDGVSEIYVMNSDGSNLIRLANNISPKFDPAWSPDGKQIAFGSYNNDSGGLYFMDADGSNPTKLIDNKELSINSYTISAGHPVWSPDGKKIAFGGGYGSIDCCFGANNIYVMNIDGSNLINARGVSWEVFITWSSDSQRIAFDSENCDGSEGICVMNADGTTHNIADGGRPTWSPDGKKIAFRSGPYNNVEVYVINVDDTDPINLTRYRKGWDGNPVWSPDGKKIAFSSYRDGNYEIYVMNADGSDQINLTNNQAGDDEPVWSPDGRKIAFVSDRDGNNEIYLIDADGSNLFRLTNNDANDYSPTWSP